MATVASLRAIVFEEGERWVAQCLEHDIAAQASNLEAVLDRLEMTIDAELALRGESGLDGIPQAPVYYHSLWDNRSLSLARVNMPVGQDFPAIDVGLAKVAA